MKSRITELLGIKYPIFQGGMAWVADGDLAGAVSNAGGLGIIGGGNAPKEVVKANIDRVKQITDKPFGVNIMLCHHLQMTSSTSLSKRVLRLLQQVPETQVNIWSVSTKLELQ